MSLSDGASATGGTQAAPIIVAGNFTAGSDTIFGGIWNVEGNLEINGFNNAGNSPGSITVGGDLILSNTTQTTIEIFNHITFDNFIVGGNANIAGSLHVDLLNSDISYRNATFRILDVAGTVSGDFEPATINSIFIDAETSITASGANAGVDLILSIADNAFQSVALTQNQKSAAAGLNSLAQTGDALTLYNSIALLTSAETARTAFTQLAGESFASVKTGLVENAHLLSDTTSDRLLTLAHNASDRSTDMWITGIGSWISHGHNANAGNLKSSTGGLLIGLDTKVGDAFYVGATGGYSNSKFRMSQRSAHATSDNWHLDLYAGTNSGPFAISLGANYTWHKIDSTRSIAFFDDVYKANYKARTLQAHGEISYQLGSGNVDIKPFAGLNYVSLHTHAAKETGGLGALIVKKDTMNTTFSTLGLRASAPIISGDREVRVRGLAGWRHAFGNTAPKTTQAFSGGDFFTVEGIAVAKDAAVLELGLDVSLSKAATFSIGYFGRFGDGLSQNGANARFSFTF